MNEPVPPSPNIKSSRRRLTYDKVQEQVDHAEQNAALPHEEAADPYYEAYLCDQIKMYAEDMQFPEQWAAEIGVTEQRMFGWIGKYPEFAEAYAVSITKLRAAYTSLMMEVAKGKHFGSQSAIYVLVAKKRFADLYGDAPAAPTTWLPATRDITPTRGQVIEGTATEDMEVEELKSELSALRKRHNL